MIPNMKQIMDLVVKNSQYQTFEKWVDSLILQEIIRVSEFDEEVQEALDEFEKSGLK